MNVHRTRTARCRSPASLAHRLSPGACPRLLPQISQNNQPLGVERTCSSDPRDAGGSSATPPEQLAALGAAAAFWLHEALLQLIPWTALYAFHCPLPLKCAARGVAASRDGLMHLPGCTEGQPTEPKCLFERPPAGP